jgi:hypothetical protein
MIDLKQAFEALEKYDRGSGRAALLPIDEAVTAALGDGAARKELERQLLAALGTVGSLVAREYIGSKLALMGSENSVPALRQLLADPQLATVARNALQAIPAREAGKALRDGLAKMAGPQKVGVINSLGARRETESVRALVKMLRDGDGEIAGAAAAALGEIGNVQAARALRAFLPKAPEAIKLKVSDAVLACAESLLAVGRKADAQALYRLIVAQRLPTHIQQAAARGLRACGVA